MSRNQLALGRPTHLTLNNALTAGFNSGVEVAGLIALLGLVAALVLVRHRQASAIAAPPIELDIAA